MESYSFIYQEKNYKLDEGNCKELINDEEKPVKGIRVSEILQLLNDYDGADFEVEYYDQPCEICRTGKAEKAKYFSFLEYRFFIYTKNGAYVISNISKDYENTSYNKLLKKKEVDNSYIVSVVVCIHCGDYFIEISQCEV